MQTTNADNPLELDQQAAKRLPYLPPTVTTYTDEQLLEALGPAQAQAYGPG